MNFSVVDPNELLQGKLFTEETFLSAVSDHDWSVYADKKVLVRGCGSTIIPPWAFMVLTGRLSEVAQSIRYGNEHDHVVVFRKKKEK